MSARLCRSGDRVHSRVIRNNQAGMKSHKIREVINMRQNMIYNLRILVIETYVRITMIGYESRNRKDVETFGAAGSPSRQFLVGKA